MRGYYYCSLDTFLNILKSKEIYLSDPLKMNDKAEIRWYLDKLNDDKNEDNIFGSIFERMRMRSGLKFSLKELLDRLDSKGQNSIYVSCFSKKSDVLSQWRAYADDGSGVAIGFDLDKFLIANNFWIEEIIYTNDISEEDEIESDIECVADTIGTVIHENNLTDREMKIDVFLHELIPVLVKYKNPAFIEEDEVRLIYCEDMKFEKIVNSYGAFKEKWEEKTLKHDFRTIRNNDITEFVRLGFQPDTITEICIGPKCALSKNDVLTISKTILGIEPNIEVSEASYR